MPAGSVVQGMAQNCLQWAAFVQIRTARYLAMNEKLHHSLSGYLSISAKSKEQYEEL